MGSAGIPLGSLGAPFCPASIPIPPNLAAADVEVPPSFDTPLVPPLPPPRESGGKRNESDFKTGGVAKLAMACRDGPQIIMAKRIIDVAFGNRKRLIIGPVGEWLLRAN